MTEAKSALESSFEQGGGGQGSELPHKCLLDVLKVFHGLSQQECLCGVRLGLIHLETLEALPALEFHPQGWLWASWDQVPFIWGYFWSVRSVGQSEEAGTAPSEGELSHWDRMP